MSRSRRSRGGGAPGKAGTDGLTRRDIHINMCITVGADEDGESLRRRFVALLGRVMSGLSKGLEQVPYLSS